MSTPGKLELPDSVQAEIAKDEAAKAAKAAGVDAKPEGETVKKFELPKTVEFLPVLCHRSWMPLLKYEQQTTMGFNPRTQKMEQVNQLLQVSEARGHPCITTACSMWNATERACTDRVLADAQIAAARLQVQKLEAELAALKARAELEAKAAALKAQAA